LLVSAPIRDNDVNKSQLHVLPIHVVVIYSSIEVVKYESSHRPLLIIKLGNLI